MRNAAPHATKRLPTGRTGSPALAGFGHGSMVVLDGGERLRLDDQVDFWPATGAWRNTDTGDTGQGPTTLFAHLAGQREKAGKPVPEPVELRSRRRVSCNYCGKGALLFTGKEVYPHRPELAERHFWVCWPCDAWVGCFERGNRDEAMGELADEAMRDARRSAHAAFDPLWQQGSMTREAAYEWLARAMAIPVIRCRIGRMSLADCRRVVELVADRVGGAPEAPRLTAAELLRSIIDRCGGWFSVAPIDAMPRRHARTDTRQASRGHRVRKPSPAASAVLKSSLAGVAVVTCPLSIRNVRISVIS